MPQKSSSSKSAPQENKNATPDARANSELEQLRSILFSNQARAIEMRIDDLEARLDAARHELGDKIAEETRALSDGGNSQHRELTDQLEKQDKEQADQLASTRQALSDRADKMQKDLTDNLHRAVDDLTKELRQTQTDVNARIDQLRTDSSERLRVMQQELRQRDDDLRQELLAISAWLDDNKTNRFDLAQMLVMVGEQLKADPKIAEEANDDE